MAKISDLGLTTEQVGQALDYASMPDQMGSFAPPPQPGAFRLRFPTKLDDAFEVFDLTTGPKPGKRIRVKFDANHPLTIIQSPGGKYDGEPFETSLSNAERKRGKKDDQDAPWISDLDYFNRDVWDLPGKPPNGNRGYAEEVIKHAGTEFGATISWNWFCNPKKAIYADNGQGGLTEVAGQMGCGTSYYMKDIKDSGWMQPANPEDPSGPKVFPLRIQCQCGGNIRAFANLEQFRK